MSTDLDGSVVDWSWDFGDSNTSDVQNPSHTYPADGTYTVALVVTDDDAATGTWMQEVTVTSGGSGGELIGSAESGRSSWSAAVTDTSGALLSGTWDYERSGSAQWCGGNQCFLTGISTRAPSVVFMSSAGESVTVLQPLIERLR